MSFVTWMLLASIMNGNKIIWFKLDMFTNVFKCYAYRFILEKHIQEQ